MTTSFIDFIVRDGGGTYQTNRVRGQQASCTHSAAAAAERLAQKVLATALDRVELVEQTGRITYWRMHERAADRAVTGAVDVAVELLRSHGYSVTAPGKQDQCTCLVGGPDYCIKHGA